MTAQGQAGPAGKGRHRSSTIPKGGQGGGLRGCAPGLTPHQELRCFPSLPQPRLGGKGRNVPLPPFPGEQAPSHFPSPVPAEHEQLCQGSPHPSTDTGAVLICCTLSKIGNKPLSCPTDGNREPCAGEELLGFLWFICLISGECIQSRGPSMLRPPQPNAVFYKTASVTCCLLGKHFIRAPSVRALH